MERVYSRAAGEVVPILREMVSHDTTIGEHDDPARGDRAHQDFVAGYLRELGAEVELFEPELDEFSAHPMYRPNQTFDGRPIVWARLPGTGGGRSSCSTATSTRSRLTRWRSGPRAPGTRSSATASSTGGAPAT